MTEHLTPQQYRRQSKPDYPAILLEQLNAAGFGGWSREVQFAWELGREWRADLLIVTRWFDPSFRLEKSGNYHRLIGAHHVARGLIVEVDGGTFVQGRHSRGAGYEKDCEKQATAAGLGFTTIKVTPRQIKSRDALSWVLAAYRKQVQII